MFAYSVMCTFEDPFVALEWIEWMKREHLQDVRTAGALQAHVVRFDGDPCRCAAHYQFESREAFEAYERDHAPRLRRLGLEAFPLNRGLRYERSTGEVVG
jgi:hypothetical protein